MDHLSFIRHALVVDKHIILPKIYFVNIEQKKIFSIFYFMYFLSCLQISKRFLRDIVYSFVVLHLFLKQLCLFRYCLLQLCLLHFSPAVLFQECTCQIRRAHQPGTVAQFRLAQFYITEAAHDSGRSLLFHLFQNIGLCHDAAS